MTRKLDQCVREERRFYSEVRHSLIDGMSVDHTQIDKSTDDQLAHNLAVAFNLGSRPLTKISAPFRAYCREFCKAVWAEQDRREKMN